MIASRVALLLVLGAAMVMAENAHASGDGTSWQREVEETEGEGEQNQDLFEGDIVPTPGVRNANSRKNIWRDRTVPYYFDPKVSSTSRRTITNALNLMMSKVNAGGKCLTIRPTYRSDRDYIHVIAGSGCYSQVGCTYRGRQDLSLGRGCLSTGTIQHEFMHALGFWHEQSRDDRDKYVTILWDNISSANRHNFNSYRTHNQGFGYDYGSVMHYGAYSFTRNRKPTIVTKGGQKIGQRNGVSNQDVMEIRRLYGC